MRAVRRGRPAVLHGEFALQRDLGVRRFGHVPGVWRARSAVLRDQLHDGSFLRRRNVPGMRGERATLLLRDDGLQRHDHV